MQFLSKLTLRDDPELLEKTVASFERRYGVSVTIHEHGGLLFDEAGRPFLPRRHHHNHPFCQTGRYENPGWNRRCLEECAYQAENIALREQRPFIHTCWKGAVETVVPVERKGTLAMVMFAGPFQIGEADESRLSELATALYILGRSLLELALDYRETGSPPGRKGEIARFLAENAHAPVGIEELAARLSLSPSRTSHLVTRLYGMPFRRLLLNERLNRARNLLLSTDYPLKAIAQATGFATEFYFNRAFREFSGLPPGEYRKVKSSTSK